MAGSRAEEEFNCNKNSSKRSSNNNTNSNSNSNNNSINVPILLKSGPQKWLPNGT